MTIADWMLYVGVTVLFVVLGGVPGKVMDSWVRHFAIHRPVPHSRVKGVRVPPSDVEASDIEIVTAFNEANFLGTVAKVNLPRRIDLIEISLDSPAETIDLFPFRSYVGVVRQTPKLRRAYWIQSAALQRLLDEVVSASERHTC